MPSENAWSPAFMPNSAADIIAKEPIQQSKLIPAPEPVIEPTKPPLSSETDTQTIIEDGRLGNGSLEAVEGDNNEHPELTNLRNALETSLASPGGVELDENPLHNGTSHTDAVQEHKVDFPSEGPAPPTKHLSTMSFARTVSQEVNWGEEDDVDPEWNLQRADTDPFKVMAPSDRTNSFPQVPPTHSPAIGFEPLPNQAEEIMNEVDQVPRDLFEDDPNDGEDDFFAQKSAPEVGLLHPASESHEHTNGFDYQDSISYGHTYGGNVQDEESQTQYEEGMPLVQAAETEGNLSASNHAAFMDDGDNGDDFFSQVSKTQETSAPKPHPLERKSTTEMMDSLHFQPHEQTHEDIPEEDDRARRSSQHSLDMSTGGGIAVSSSTVISQVLGDPEAPIHGQPENLARLEMVSGDGDLAEKWKAALAEDEFLDDDDELLADDEPTEKAIDPADIFGSDDEGFLEDTEDLSTNLFSQQTSPPILAPVTGQNGNLIGFDSLSGSAQMNRPGSSGNKSNRYLPSSVTTTAPPPNNTYAPSGPLLTDLSRSATSGPVPSPYASSAIGSSPPQVQQQRPELYKAQSFADKSKGGYSSPYDLPMEVVKPRKRVSMQAMNRGYSQPAPPPVIAPPRSSSMHSQPPPPSRGSTSSLSPPSSSHGIQQGQAAPGPNAQQAGPPTLKSKSSFFEELPMSSRPKAATRHSTGQSSQVQSPYTHPDAQHPPTGVYASQPQQASQSHPTLPAQNLVAPERVSPYASLPLNNPTVPAVANRYSPAPMQHTQTAPPPVARYSPAPPNPRQNVPAVNTPPVSAPPPTILPHQPRTSSPLAHFSHDLRSSSGPGSLDRRSSSSYDSNLRPHHLPPTREVDENEQSGRDRHYGELSRQYSQPSHPPPGMRATQTPPPPTGLAARMGNSPPKRASSSYLPHQPPTRPSPPSTFVPPQRSQTQSPGTAYTGPRLEISTSEPHLRPASVEVPPSPRAHVGTSAPIVTTGRARGFSQALNYIAPTDGREHDPMQRWRGAPVFVWGVGGTLITSFPKDVPRYGMSQTIPMIIRSPGEVKIRNIKDVDPLPERLTTFPGPLKGKSKKKDVISWLSSGIQMLDQNASYLRTVTTLTHEDKRTEERILLWKILRVFIENDGILEGNPLVDKAVRAVLSPGLDDEYATSAPLYATGADLSGISQSSNAATRADPVDPTAVDQLRKHLLRGEREKAVWEAVDKRLWAHAMLISNTVSKELYKQVAQEFVQKEVKNTGDNTESLAALYEIFAGNFEESIDELVPPSARAGFHMVSTSNTGGPSKDALDGLDRWRETLGLVLSNRSMDDSQALNALGKLLSGYGRAEAAHICFLFARAYSVFGGIDDPSANIVLVGSDHLRQPYEFDKEMEPILLSEVYEYGISLSSTSNIAVSSPHLSAYKLQHAMILAEYGFREKALQYCEAIASSITSQTRRSPYHHAMLVSELDDLSKRLKASPKDEKGSWISKPSIDKVSGSVWSTFNKFVAGEESDAGTPASVNGSTGDVGPFARIAGGTPTISRSPSNSEIYGSYNGSAGINGQPPKPSRYAPGGPYTPDPVSAASYQSAPAYGSQPRASFEERSSGEHRRGHYEPIHRDSDRPSSQPTMSNNYTPQTSSSYIPQSSSYTPHGNDSPYAAAGSPYTPQQSASSIEGPTSNVYSPPKPVNPYDGQQQSSYTPPEPSFEAQSLGYEPPNSYEPPSTYGYEPPSSSYEPTTMNEEPGSPIDIRPKKSFMDDDDEDIPALKPAPASREKTKAEKDREADEAFRKAAEADGKNPTNHLPLYTNVFSSRTSKRSSTRKERLGTRRLVQRWCKKGSRHGLAAQQAHPCQTRRAIFLRV